MPETTDYSLIINKLNSEELFKNIKRLIDNVKLRKKLQIQGFKNVKHSIKDNAKLIDEIRSKLIHNFNLNFIKKKLRIINLI